MWRVFQAFHNWHRSVQYLDQLETTHINLGAIIE